MKSATICPIHGFKLLSRRQSQDQLRSESEWKCPVCQRDSKFIEIPHELFDVGCAECHKDLREAKDLQFSETFYALFCDKLCMEVYLERFRARNKK